jgi:RNA polymerase-associated protein CTR9
VPSLSILSSFAPTEINRQAREASDIPDVCVNLAHVYLHQKHYVNAIKMYQLASSKYYGNRDTTVLLFLARAYMLAGKMTECKKTLLEVGLLFALFTHLL